MRMLGQRAVRLAGLDWVGWAALAVALIIITPIGVILGSVLMDSGGVWQHLRETVLLRFATNSLLLAGGAALGAAVLGVSTAWLVTLYEFPLRRAMDWLLLLPMAMPTYLIAYTYTDFLDFGGPVQTALRELTGWGTGAYFFPQIRSLPGAVILFSFVLYPYVYLLSRAAFMEQSVSLLEGARLLGRTPMQIFHGLAIPMARPAWVGGMTLVMMEALADYGAVDYLAIDTFTTGIYRTWAGMASPVGAAQLASLLLMSVLLLMVIERLSRGGRRFAQTAGHFRAVPRWRLSPVQAFFVFIYCLLPVLIGFLLPCAILLQQLTRPGGMGTLAGFWRLASSSLLLALTAAVLAVGCSLLVLYAQRRSNNWRMAGVRQLAGIGYAVPGAVIAIGILLMFGRWDRFALEVGVLPLIGGSVAGLLFAYLVRFLAVSLNTLDAGMAKIHLRMDEVARTLNASAGRILTMVHFPLLRGSIWVALLLVFVDVLKELPATLILRPFNFDTLAIRVYQLASDERLAEAALPALVIVGTGLLPVIVLSHLLNTPSNPPVEKSASEESMT